MPRRRIGGYLVLLGVLAVLVTVIVTIVDAMTTVKVGVLLYLLLAACLALLGSGLALISVDGPLFDGTLARRGMKTLAFGLIGDSVIFGMWALPAFERSNAMTLLIPFLVVGWATIIGAGMTALALLLSAGRPRQVGAIFLVVPVALEVMNTLTNMLSGGNVIRVLAIACGVVAAVALLAGFVAFALLAIDGPADSRSPVSAATDTTT
jgi:hypothetical protein